MYRCVFLKHFLLRPNKEHAIHIKTKGMTSISFASRLDRSDRFWLDFRALLWCICYFRVRAMATGMRPWFRSTSVSEDLDKRLFLLLNLMNAVSWTPNISARISQLGNKNTVHHLISGATTLVNCVPKQGKKRAPMLRSSFGHNSHWADDRAAQRFFKRNKNF